MAAVYVSWAPRMMSSLARCRALCSSEAAAPTAVLQRLCDLLRALSTFRTAQNGGVNCDASYAYMSTGDGLALSNSEDELIVTSASGQRLDRVSYGEGFAPVGRSIGVRVDRMTPDQNDNAGAWCAQSGALSGGDQGTPGQVNSGC